MLHRCRSALLLAVAGAVFALLAGCSGSTEVSLSGNTPAQYSHVYVTISGVRVNNNSNAGPDDSGWTEFDFSTPTTVDLVSANSTNLSALTSSLRLVPGSYSLLSLIPVDASTALSTSATDAGALYNFEADYVDAAGVTHQLPLELLSPNKGINIQTGLKVPLGSVSAALSSSGLGGTSSTTTGTTDTGLGTTTTGTDSTTTGTGTTGVGIGGGSTSSSSSTPTNQFAVFMDGTTDLVPFTFGSSSACASAGAAVTGCNGILLSQHASAYDLSKSGGISGTLTLTNITTGTSGLPAIQVSAQVLSADGSRHVIVSSTTVGADGTFTLYPLAASNDGSYYDVVIHGPGIATIIIKNVIVTLPDSSNNSLSGLGGSTTSTTSTTGSTDTTLASTTTTGSTSSSGVTENNVVQIGTLTPRSATSYTATLATSPVANLPAGTVIQFMQALSGKGNVPYVIEENPVDFINQDMVNAQALSTGTVDSGTWAATGATVALVSAAPIEGAGTYIVSPSAPLYAGSSLGTTVTGTAASSTTTTTTTAAPVTFTVPTLSLPSGTSQGTLSADVTEVSAGKYDQGELLVSNNGTLVAAVSLNGVFAGGSGGSVSVKVPAGIPSCLYYLTVRAWKNGELNASEPIQGVTRQWYANPVDLRSAKSASVSLSVN
jgi:trimeric autotransporter adhesin